MNFLVWLVRRRFSQRRGSRRLREDLVGGSAARADRALHVAVPLDGVLRPGPVHPADRLAENVAVAGPHAWREVGAIAAPRELLGAPVLLGESDRAGCLRPEVPDEAVEDGAPSFGRGQPLPLASLASFDEADQDADLASGGRDVEGHFDRSLAGARLAVEALVPPERRRVGREVLDHGPGRELLCQLVAPGGEQRVVVQAASEGRRHRDDDAVRGVGFAGPGRDRDACAVLGNVRDLRTESYVESLGKTLRYEYRATDDPVLLRTLVDGDERLEIAVAHGVEERMEK